MIPKSISASAGLVFEGCEARYKAEYIERIPDLTGVAAARGSAVHGALEVWVSQGCHTREWPDVLVREKSMKVVWDAVYWDYFSDKSEYAEGWKMLNRWLQRSDWEGREVLSTELKETFDLPTSIGPLPVTYIWDRCDLLQNGDIEIIDYKTVAIPVQPDELKQRIQPRLYAVSAAIKYPHAKRIWVTYDLLRYEQVSAAFTRDDNVETWHYLRALAERIIASDGTKETLNNECRFCVRKHVCETLQKNAEGGGIMRYASKEDVADRRAQVEIALGAMRTSLDELDAQLFEIMEQEEIFEFDTSNVSVSITAQSRRHADSERVSAILGPEIMLKYGKVGIGDLDDIMKVETLTPNQLSQLKQCIRKQTGTPRIKTKYKSVFEED